MHPGYSFLAENTDFADAIEAAGLIRVGPKGDAIRVMDDKVAARVAAESSGVPVVPGSDWRIDDSEHARNLALAIGFPVMIKASTGGGGGLYMEKVIERARHIEVQILGDGTRAIYCFERECSL